MKRHKRLLILTAVLVLICLAFLALKGHQDKQDQLLEEAGVVVQIPAEDIVAFSWDTFDSGSFAFQKTDSGWKIGIGLNTKKDLIICMIYVTIFDVKK